MSRLPLLSTISQSFAVLAAYPGKILFWMLVPVALSVVALGIGVGFFAASEKWWTAAPFGVLAVFFWMPFCIRLNQLTVLGRVEPGGYFEKIFDAQSVRFFRYVCITSSLYIVGMAMAAAPALLHGYRHGFEPMTGTLSLAVFVGMVLFTIFLVLFAPFNLIYPAASVEASPSLGRAYALGAGNKLRLFAAMLAVQLLFVLLGMLVDGIGNAFGGSSKMPQVLLLFPLHLSLAFAANVLNMIVPAVAYRSFRNMPDPMQLQPRTSQALPVDAVASEAPEVPAPNPPKEPLPPTGGER